MTSAGHFRSFHPHRFTIVLVGIAACFLVAYFSVVGRRGASADDKPPLSKEEAITEVERLGGKVRIDGERDDQPVWAVEFQEAKLRNDDLRLLASFPHLEALNLADTAIDDEGLSHVAGCKRLKELDLSRTKITDRGLLRVAQLDLLEKLDLSGTKATNAGLKKLVPLQKLREVFYFDTEITESGFDEFVLGQRQYRPSASSTKATNIVAENTEPPVAMPFAGTLHELGRALFPSAIGDPVKQREAVALLEQAWLANPANELIRLDLADAYVRLQTEETMTLALGLYESVLAERPGDDALLARIADAYGRLGNFDAAIAVAAARLKNRDAVKTPFPAALQIADFATQSRDTERGIQELQAVVKSYPQDAGVKLLFVTLLLDAGQSEAARSQIDAVLKILPEDAPLAKEARRLQKRSRS